jgi:Cys-tRNA(Pro)/Cys-tRNA(Cys) deacylase
MKERGMQLPVHDYLDAVGIPYTTGSFPSTTAKGAAEVAKALGYQPRQMVKTLIFEVDTGEKVLVMVGGDQNAISGHLKKAMGSRNIKLASPQVVQETTGYAIGSIPPFHWQPPQFRTFMDAALVHEDILGAGTGVWGQEIFMTPTHLVQASHAIVVNLTDASRPVLPA